VVGKIEGRIDDLLLTADGRDVGRLDPVFKDAAGIAEAQIIQESLNNISVRFVPTTGFEDGVKQKIADRIRERMGNVDVAFEVVDEIPRTKAGKFRAVVCELSYAEKAGVRKRLSWSAEA
jgi:phenylacetate-CoA ligase